MEPDYTKYTLSDLIDARGSIDKSVYPERFDSIEEQMTKRNPKAELKHDFFHTLENKYTKRLYLYNFCGGIIMLAVAALGYYVLSGDMMSVGFKILVGAIFLIILMSIGFYTLHKKSSMTCSNCGKPIFAVSTFLTKDPKYWDIEHVEDKCHFYGHEFPK